ncbi:MAG: hypothetical protein ACYDG3_14920, partial [Bacillati bacterium]
MAGIISSAKAANTSPSNGISVTLGSVNVNNGIFVAVSLAGSGISVQGVVDSQGGSYKQVATLAFGGNTCFIFGRASPAAAGSLTISAFLSASAASQIIAAAVDSGQAITLLDSAGAVSSGVSSQV